MSRHQRKQLQTLHWAQKLDASFMSRMGLKEKVLKPKNPLQAKYGEHFFCQGFPVISEADDEEVI
ncbi:hypothetical protein A2U01_0026088 [Trifolium medium]|uniref:Uncharacterized protein n=1 Tax=Trifolium medium TaxID=97028 RepID=A0A392P0U8_9FABA|nr:hypothetical protein [Trifolium medium]